MNLHSIWRKVSFSRQEAVPPCRVYTIGMEGSSGLSGTLKRLSPDGDFSQSSINPDGQKVAFWGTAPDIPGHHLWVAHIPNHSCTKLTHEPGLHGHPAWWPDGRSIVFFSTEGASGSRDWNPAKQFSPERPSANLVRVDLETGAQMRLTQGDYVDERPAVSPSGQEIAFVSNRSGKLNLWSLDVATLDIRQLTAGSDLDYRPAFSPAGDRLAYFTKTNSGTHQLAVVTWPEMNPIPVHTEAEFQWVHGPFWPDMENVVLFHALRIGEPRPGLWQLNMTSHKFSRLKLPDVSDSSHGSLDRSGTILAFDSREELPVAGPTVI